MSATDALTLAATAVMLAVTAPGLRLLGDGAFRGMFPRVWLAALGVVGGWVAVTIALAVLAPRVLWLVAALAGALGVAAAVRARPGFGRSRGVPEGSLSFVRSVAGLADRSFYLAAAHRHGPIFKTAQFHRPTACVVGLERGHRVLLEHADSIVTPPLPFTSEIPGGFLRYMEPTNHDVYGPLFRRALVPAIAETAGPATTAASRRELDRLAGDAPPAAQTSAALRAIAYDGLARALLGVEPDTDAADELRECGLGLAAQDLAAPVNGATRASLEVSRTFLRGHLERLTAVGDPPRSALTELRLLEPTLPDQTCLDNLLFTLRIATGNVSDLMHWLLAQLAGDQAWPSRLRADAREDRATRPDLRDRFVMETLRLGQSEYLYRRTTDAVEIEGASIPAGWLVRVCVAESHRDPAVFDDPDRFDPDRFATRRYTSSEYSPLGFGRHACNGVTLTNVVCHAFLTELVTAYDVEVRGGERQEHDFRHWRHWRPGSDLSLRVTPVDVTVVTR